MAPHEAREVVTPDNLSPVISIMTWILMSSSILGVTAKVWMKRAISHTLSAEDWILILSLVLVIAQSIAVSFQAANGIGMHLKSLDSTRIETFEKAGYASNLLLMPCLAASKSAILLLLGSITPVVAHSRTFLVFGGFIALWTVISLFAAAFQCEAPNRWAILGPQCFNQISFWTYYGIINMLSEAVLFALPVWTFWRVRMKRRARVGLMFCFGTRATIIAATGFQLSALRLLSSSSDPTFDGWKYYLATQFIPNLSIVTACIPHVKTLLLGMESGYFQTGAFGLSKGHEDHSSRGRSWSGYKWSKRSSEQRSAARSEPSREQQSVNLAYDSCLGGEPTLRFHYDDHQVPRTLPPLSNVAAR